MSREPYFEGASDLMPKAKVWVAQTHRREKEGLTPEASGEVISSELQQKMRTGLGVHEAFLEPFDANQSLLKRLREAGL